MNLYTVLGVFPEKSFAEQAVTKLEQSGFNPKDMSLVTKGQGFTNTDNKNTKTENIAKGALSGAATGAVVGGIAGLLVGFGVLAIPGLGAFLVGGPIAVALGLTGTAAATISGAATGAIAGGILGALMGLGLPDQDSQSYEQQINESGVLLAVPAREEEIADVKELLHLFHASQIRSFIMDDNAVTTQPAAVVEPHAEPAPVVEPITDSEIAENAPSDDDEGNLSAADVVEDDEEEFPDRENLPGRPAYAYVGMKGGSTRRQLSEDLFGTQPKQATDVAQPSPVGTIPQDQPMQNRPIRRIKRDVRF